MADLKDLLARLKHHYGAPSAVPPAKGPFELILWENACYLLPDKRRQEVFEALRNQVGLSPASILGASQAVLLPLATRGGMRPETRVFRWREIARITQDQFKGDLGAILKLPYKEAKKALKQFPNIGDPAAEKILLFSGVTGELPLESNGLRVLTRFGFEGSRYGSHGATYRFSAGGRHRYTPCRKAAGRWPRRTYFCASTARRSVSETVRIALTVRSPIRARLIYRVRREHRQLGGKSTVIHFQNGADRVRDVFAAQL